MSGGVALSTLAALLATFPAAASQPEGLAGKIITNAAVADHLVCTLVPGFEWYESLGVTEVAPSDTLTVDLAVIPFETAVTSVGLDEGAFATTFVSLIFEDGLVRGLPYRRFGWNDVTVEVRFATQDCLLELNGVQAGPFPFDSQCPGGCFCVQAFRVNGGSRTGGDIAWLDSVEVTRRSGGNSGLYCGTPPIPAPTTIPR
jgi:hypothetical protein